MTDVEGTWMLLDGLKDTNSTDVVSSGEVNSGTIDKLDDTLDLASCQVYLYKISRLMVDRLNYL